MQILFSFKIAGNPGGSRNLSAGSKPYEETNKPKLFWIKLLNSAMGFEF